MYPVALPVFGVKQAGAIGDGVADDTAAINETYAAAAAAGGGIVWYPKGIYLTSDQIGSNADNVHTVGAGKQAQILRAPGYLGVLLQHMGQFSSVRDITVNGNGANVTGTVQFADIEVAGAYSEVAGTQVINSMAIGIALGANYCSAIGNVIIGLGKSPAVQQGYGIWADAPSTCYIVVKDNLITGTGIDGIGVGASCSVISGNRLWNCHSYGGEGGGQIVIYSGANDWIIANNIVEMGNSVLSCGLELNGTDGSIIGNVISYQQREGIVADSGSGFFISGNKIKACGQASPGAAKPEEWISAAIAFNPGCMNFTVTGNDFVDDQATPTMQCGVYIWPGASDGYTIMNNNARGITGDIVFDGGTGLKKILTPNFSA